MPVYSSIVVLAIVRSFEEIAFKQTIQCFVY